MKGRRLPDTKQGELPEDFQRYDYWKEVNADGTPVKETRPNKLTDEVWWIVAPIGDGEEYAIGRLVLHTVREHEDGTISVRPGDGSSNSILITGSYGQQWHGYIEHGVWRKC